jgi:DNA polymerase/3'-5' exonuclease PolX
VGVIRWPLVSNRLPGFLRHLNKRIIKKEEVIMDNRTIAQRLADHARDLEGKDGNLYRIRAYRRAVGTILGLDRPVTDLLAERGRAALASLPGIGRHLSFTIEQLARTGEFRTLANSKSNAR